MKKYHIEKKNEGTWIKWSIVDEKGIVKFVGIAKDAKKFIKDNNLIIRV